MIKWLRKNLFKDWIDGSITVVIVGLCVWLAAMFVEWAFVRSVWNANSLEECQQIVAALHGEDQLGACWAILSERMNQFLFGFYPEELYWRPVLAFFLLLAALAPIVFHSLPRKLIWFSAAYPFIAYILIWGLFGLEPVHARNFGGFLTTMVLGVAGVAVALVLGIILALGRQYGILFTRVLCSALTAVLTGIPIIVLMFVGAVLLNYIIPPGVIIPFYIRVIFVLGVVGAAKIAAAFRHELNTISPGQLEAAKALGLSSRKTFWLVTLPLAYIRSIPQIALEFAEVFQNTSIVALMGLIDPVSLINAVTGSVEWRGIMWELYIAIALLYWIISFSITSYSKYYAQKLKREQFTSITNSN